MNICILTSSFPSRPDDIVQAPFLIDFIEGLRKRQHQVFLFTQDRNGVKEEFLEGVHIKWFPWMKSKRPLVQLNPMNPLDCVRIGSLLHNGQRELFSYVKENKIEACLALWVLPSGYFANRAYRQTGVPYSVWALGSDIYRYGRYPFLYPVMKRIVWEARGVFADGFDLSKRVEQRFGRKCFFLATTRALSETKKEMEKKPSPTYLFLFIGRLEKVKGLDLLLQSMALLTEEALDIHLTIVGKGRLQEWAKVFVRQKGLGKRVSMVGNISDEALASLYASADCVVIPSRSESIPLVFSEAIRFNKELIVADVGDMGMLGRQYGVAWVIPPEDPVVLKEMMKRRAEFQDGDTERARTKREELNRLFNIETSVERFLADYR
jgi:glycosyltransferase involved in cell wall biosynthesis